ncbi:hypothetical protein [Actinoplanes sp. GCM10030250]|uniref:hypothetical protein n=1 Tax=Actinoplanes sp. GCM10030250 TaxID=3273376 RepID=UPI00360914E7
MTQQPAWLRNEGSYRMYVRGLRGALLAFAAVAVFVLLGATGVAGTWIPTIGVLAGFAVAIPAVPVAMIGWLRVPDKNRANLHQGAFLRMVGHDIVRGIPPGTP